MKKSAGFLLGAVLLSGCAQLERAPYDLSHDQLAPYVQFVLDNTEYSLAPLPRVIVDRREMTLAYSGSASALAFAPFALAWNGNIYLDHTRFDISQPRHRSTLVHELVHHGQYLAYQRAVAAGPNAVASLRARKGWDCNKSLEHEAYAVELKWAKQYDIEAYRSIDAVNVHQMAACPRGYRDQLFTE